MGLFSKKHDEHTVNSAPQNVHGQGTLPGGGGAGPLGHNNQHAGGGPLASNNNPNVGTGITHGQTGTGLTGNSHTHGAGTGAGLTGTGAGLSGTRTADVDPSYGSHTNAGHPGTGYNNNVAGGGNVHAGHNTDPLGHSNIAGHNGGLGHSTNNGLAGHNNNATYDNGLGHSTNNGLGHTTGGIPPTSSVNHNATHGGGGKSTTGKIESKLGSMLGSESLKAKGLQKEQEAQAIKMQGAELAEAERLEKEALMRRERAVAHGAHPGNAHPTGHSGIAGGDMNHGGIDPTRNAVGGAHMSS